MKIECADIEATKALAAQIAEITGYPDCILLSGTLGAGKTAFVKAFVDAFAGPAAADVTSPTFTICNIYDVKGVRLYHFDLYRIKDQNELYELGIDEALDSGICLFEWPEIAINYMPVDRLEISITQSMHGDARIFSLQGFGNWVNKLVGCIDQNTG